MSEKINISELPPVYYDTVNPKHEVDIIDYGVVESNVHTTIHYYSNTDSIKKMDKIFANNGSLENVEIITNPIPIYGLQCTGRFSDAPQIVKSKYEKYEPKIRDAYINNRYCYISYLKWFFNLKDHPLYNSNAQYDKQIVCVGHSNKMQDLFDTVLKKTAAPKSNNINEESIAISFIRHGLSCNNIASMLAIRKTGPEPQKDWDPSLTVYGMLSAIKKGKNIGKKYSNDNNINVCVSPLLRTWQTAILLFCNNYETITLHICPYLTEAYPAIGELSIKVDRGNVPIEFKWQLYKLLYFLRLLKDNRKSFVGDDNILLTNIHLKFIDMNGTVYSGLNYSIPMNDVENMSIYKNDTDNTKIQNIQIPTKKPILTCSEKIEKLEKYIPLLQNRLDSLKAACPQNISGGDTVSPQYNEDMAYKQEDENNKKIEEELMKKIEEELKAEFEKNKPIVKKTFDKYKEHNMWEIELVIQNDNIVKMKITEGIDKPKINGKSSHIIKECEESCVLGSISKNVPKKNSTCATKLNPKQGNNKQITDTANDVPFINTAIKAVTPINTQETTYNRDSTSSNDSFDLDKVFPLNEHGRIAKPPSLFSRLFGTRKKVHPAGGRKKNHRKTNKKHRSRKSRR
jgi:hypothetical protein